MLGVLLSAGEGEPASHERGARVLRLCADPDNLPFSSAAPGERGLYVDLAELVAAKLVTADETAGCERLKILDRFRSETGDVRCG